MIDMRGNRIRPDGTMINAKDLKSGHIIMDEGQKEALVKAFASPGLSCMYVCSEIPFVSGAPKDVQEVCGLLI